MRTRPGISPTGRKNQVTEKKWKILYSKAAGNRAILFRDLCEKQRNIEGEKPAALSSVVFGVDSCVWLPGVQNDTPVAAPLHTICCSSQSSGSSGVQALTTTIRASIRASVASTRPTISFSTYPTTKSYERRTTIPASLYILNHNCKRE